MLIIIIIIILILVALCYKYYPYQTENFNETSGKLCHSCKGKTFNECMGCFNCGYCIDEWGNGMCIGGDANSGPYNAEKCKIWYQGDQFVTMKQHNENYKCSYGPPNQNRIIGVNPPGQLNVV